jgi:hypothetical protein
MKYLLLLLLVGCTTTSERNIERARNALLNFQAMCMAAEQDDSYRYDCVRAKYDLCVEAFRQHRQIWYMENITGSRGRSGHPTDILEMNHTMAINGCRPGLE